MNLTDHCEAPWVERQRTVAELTEAPTFFEAHTTLVLYSKP